MNKTGLSAMVGVLLSASLLFAQAGGTAGSSVGGTTGGMSGSGPGGSPNNPNSPTMPDRSLNPDDGSLGGNSPTGRLNGNGSDDGAATDPSLALPSDRGLDDDRTRGSLGSGSVDSDDEPGSTARSLGR
jgi:hypothetical protein